MKKNFEDSQRDYQMFRRVDNTPQVSELVLHL